MKYCENCGTQLEDTDMFCGNCGTQQSQVSASQNDAGVQQQMQNVQQQSYKQTELQTAPNLGRKFNKKILIPVIVVAVIAVVAVVIYTQMKKRVDINNYITVEYGGYNTVGTAKYKIDTDGLTQAILKAKGKSSSQYTLDSISGNYNAYEMLREYLKVSLDKREDLANGDTVVLKIECNSLADSALGVKFIYKDKEYKVEGLKEAEQVDIFSDVSVTFSGISPNAKVSVSNNSGDSYLSGLSLKASKTSGIAVGDKITVTVTVDEKEALSKGYVITQQSKEYTCEKLDQYVTSVDSLSAEQLENLKKLAQDKIEAYFAQNNLSGKVNGYIGAYTLVQKNSSSFSSNKVYIIYTADITANTSYSGTDTVTQTVYIPVNVNNVLLKAEGKVTHDSSLYLSGSTKVGYWTYVQGYASGEDMYKDLITAQKDRYTYTVSGEVKQFGE